jgi:hypothetical protein
MKTLVVHALVILVASAAVGVRGAPPEAGSEPAVASGAYIPPPAGGMMNAGPVGGQMSSGGVGGSLSPGGFLGPLNLGSTFNSGIPGGSLYFGPGGILQNPAPATPSGGTLSGNGVGGVKSSVIVAGANTPSPVGGALSGNGVGGVRSGVIVAGGGTGTAAASGAVTPSARSVIVTESSTK